MAQTFKKQLSFFEIKISKILISELLQVKNKFLSCYNG